MTDEFYFKIVHFTNFEVSALKTSLWGQAPCCILPSWVMSSLSTFSLFCANNLFR